MTVAVYLPVLAATLLGLVGPRLAHRCRALGAVNWAVTLAAGLAGLTTVWSLALLAGGLLDEALPPGHHPIGLLAEPGPAADAIGVLATGWLVAGAVRIGRVLAADRTTCRSVRLICDGEGGGGEGGGGEVVVLASPVPQAFAAPVGGGRIVVSTGMLAALSPAQRRVLFAHERAHLRGRHHWHGRVVRLAAAVNPVLAPLARMGSYLCERQADEVAARHVGDRRLAATALARAALAVPSPATATGSVPGTGMPRYHEVGVCDRVAELQEPPARPRPLRLGLVLLVMAVATAGAVVADIDATRDFLRSTIPLLIGR